MNHHINQCESVLTKGARPQIPDGKLQEFLSEVDNLCMKYDLVIGHEDWYGGFLVVHGYDEDYMRWFMAARDPNSPHIRVGEPEAES